MSQPMLKETPRPWKTGLCDCTAGPDGSNRCCNVFWCGACAYGRMTEHEDTPIGVPGKGTCLGGALMWFTSMGIITTAVADNAIRNAENIEGSWFGDLCNAIFCRPCAQCRQAREVDLKGQ